VTDSAPVYPPPRGGGPADRGLATVWAALAVAVLVGVMAAGLDLAAAVACRHRAEAAADLAALAAAGEIPRGAEAACARAVQVAASAGARVVLCRVQNWDAIVEAEATVRLSLLGTVHARGRAHAGPAAAPTPPEDGR
jgi:secretion/DNA translocation related TadE-like protein